MFIMYVFNFSKKNLPISSWLILRFCSLEIFHVITLTTSEFDWRRCLPETSGILNVWQRPAVTPFSLFQ